MSAGELVTTVVVALLGSGGVAFVRSLFRGFGSLRAGARATERAAISDLRRRAADAEDDGDYWRDIAAGYRYQLREAGIGPVPADPIPPSRRRTKS